jgi:hypothetical protein
MSIALTQTVVFATVWFVLLVELTSVELTVALLVELVVTVVSVVDVVSVVAVVVELLSAVVSAKLMDD